MGIQFYFKGGNTIRNLLVVHKDKGKITQKSGVILTLSTPRGTDSSFQPVPNMTIILFIVNALPCQVGL